MKKQEATALASSRPSGVRKATTCGVRKSARIEKIRETQVNAASSKKHQTLSSCNGDDDRRLKRKHPPDFSRQSPHEPLAKRACLNTPPDTLVTDDNEPSYDSEEDWAWMHSTAGTNRMTNPNKRRANSLSRSNSNSETTRSGSSSRWWTKQHEQNMNEQGMIMETYGKPAAISDASRTLCAGLKSADCHIPKTSRLDRNRVSRILDIRRYSSEALVVRDILPIIVPSPGLLAIDGVRGLENLTEGMNAEWQCSTLCGPKPKPDFVAGISSKAFTEEEVEKLRQYHTSVRPNLFPEKTYFPFLICEVKGSDRPIREAERQAMHSTSIVLHAILQLYSKAGIKDHLNGKILAFSVSHNNTVVKIYGHFVRIEGHVTTYNRYRIHSSDFAVDLDSDSDVWMTPYKIVRAIYKDFAPEHIKRIKYVLDVLPNRALESFTSQLGFEDDGLNSQPSQERGELNKAAILTSKLELVERQLIQQAEMIEQQQKEFRQREEKHEVQLKQQEEEARRREEKHEAQMKQQQEEAREQRTLFERHMEQQKDLIALLKQARP